jgi:magnesium-transporting ATPase (P-type)
LIARGEATAEVTATGVHTKFGRTAELVRTAHVVSSQQKAVLRIVRNLAIFNGVVILLIGGYAYAHAMPWSEIIALLLTSVLAAVPVALPATFTLAAALGARALAKVGVLPTRLSAVDEAATLNSVLKKIVQVLLLAIGLVMTGHAVLTPMLMVIVMITGDFLAMSLTTDRVRPSQRPNAWRIGRITTAGVILGFFFLAFCTAVLAVGKFQMGLGVETLRTLSVVAIVYGSQATIYAIRERRHLWGLRPTIWMVLCSVLDLLIISTLALRGIAMAPYLSLYWPVNLGRRSFSDCSWTL